MQTLRQKFNRTLAFPNARQRLVTNGLILLGLDPSRTTLIRRRFAAEMKARFKRLSRAIQELVVTDDVFGLSPKSPFVFMQMKEAWRFQTDANKVASYRKWLQQQVDEKILTVSAVDAKPWTATYVESSYKKGIGRAYDDTRKFDLYEGTREQFLRDAFSAPEMLSKIELVSTRAFTQLQGVTDAMSQQMSRILADGIAAGRGPAAIARELRDNVANISKRRAEVLARTEIINAHSEGQLDSFERLGVEEVGIEAEWSTAGDDRVCEQCGAMEGEVMPVKEARGLIPLHPNCRCAWIPMTARKKEQVLETVRQDMYGEIDRMTKERGAPLDSRRAVAELYEKFGTRVDGQLVKYYRWNEYNPLEQSQILEAIKTSEFVTKNKHVLDLLRRQEGHNFVRIGSKAADPYLRSLGVAQKEINAFDNYLAKIFDKVSPRKIPVPKPIVKPKVAAPKPTAPVTPAPAGTAGTKFATAEDYRQYLLQQVEAARDPALVKEIKRLSDESKAVWKKWTNTYASDPQHAGYGQQGIKIDKELKVLRKQIKVSVETQRQLLDEVSNKIGQSELIGSKETLKRYQEVHDSILRWIPGKRETAFDFGQVGVEGYSRGASSLSGTYGVDRTTISMFVKSKQVYAHEFGHHVAYQLKGFMSAQTRFFRDRTVGEKIVQLMRDFRGKKDKWNRIDVYAGRVYESMKYGHRAPEVASVGIETLWANPVKFAKKDPEWFNMIVSQIKGIPTKAGIKLAPVGEVAKVGRGIVGRVAKVKKISKADVIYYKGRAKELEKILASKKYVSPGLRKDYEKSLTTIKKLLGEKVTLPKVVKPKVVKPKVVKPKVVKPKVVKPKVVKPKVVKPKVVKPKTAQAKWEASLSEKDREEIWYWGKGLHADIHAVELNKPSFIAPGRTMKDAKRYQKKFYSFIKDAPNTKVKVFRGSAFSDFEFPRKDYVMGNIVKFKTTTSATSSESIAMKFMRSHPKKDLMNKEVRYLFEIDAKTAVDFRNLPVFKVEKELILRKGTEYEVKKVIQEKGFTRVILKEIK